MVRYTNGFKQETDFESNSLSYWLVRSMFLHTEHVLYQCRYTNDSLHQWLWLRNKFYINVITPMVLNQWFWIAKKTYPIVITPMEGRLMVVEHTTNLIPMSLHQWFIKIHVMKPKPCYPSLSLHQWFVTRIVLERKQISYHVVKPTVVMPRVVEPKQIPHECRYASDSSCQLFSSRNKYYIRVVKQIARYTHGFLGREILSNCAWRQGCGSVRNWIWIIYD